MIFGIFGRQNGVGSLRSPSPRITDAEREAIEPECPKCGAQPGYWCLTEAGMPASDVCPERLAVSG